MPQGSNAMLEDNLDNINIYSNVKSDILLLHGNGPENIETGLSNLGHNVDKIHITELEYDIENIRHYKTIIIWNGDGGNYERTNMGNLLYEYVKQGGLVIQGLYSFYSGGSYTLLGNWNNYELDPIKEAPCCNLAYQYGEDSDSKLLEDISFSTTRGLSVTAYDESEILASYSDGTPFIVAKRNVVAINAYFGGSWTGDLPQLLSNIDQFYEPLNMNIMGDNEFSHQLNSQNARLSLNITIENGTTYDAYLNGNWVDTQNYQNGTIDIDISKLYSNYTYTNYTVFNNTKYEYSNLTLAFHTEQNNTYTHFVNVTVYDYLPQIVGTTSMNFNYEIGNSLSLKFNVSDDNPDMVYVYSNNVLLYSQNWTYNLNIDVNNFINSSNKLGYNYYKVIFEDIDNNQVEYNLQINVLDTVNPIFTSVFADDYIEGDEFGIISFSVDDVTLDRYAVFANDIELANSTFGNTSYIEISNSGLLAGNYEVEIVVYDRANNIAKITTSFVVESQGVTSTVTVDPPVSNSTVTSDTSTSDNNTITVTETNNVTIQGNNTQNVSVPASLPISDLPLILFASFIGLYIFRKNRK